LSEGRGSDVACRYGGEEFGLILPQTTRTKALETAERHRERLAQLTWADRPGLRISASFGVADLGSIATPPTPEALVRAADESLYRAKANGRNCVDVSMCSSSRLAG